MVVYHCLRLEDKWVLLHTHLTIATIDGVLTPVLESMYRPNGPVSIYGGHFRDVNVVFDAVRMAMPIHMDSGDMIQFATPAPMWAMEFETYKRV